MAIRIVRNQDGNCITFQGSTNPVYWNACLSAEVDAENPDRINVINDIRSADGPTVYEFFKIPFTEFRDADGNSFATAQDAADYITVNARVVDVTAASYRGVWDANTNTPALSDGDTPNQGDFYYVSTNGSTTLGGISTWRRGDRILWNGSVWQKLEATSVVDANTRTTLLDTQTSVFADGEHATKDPQGAPGWYYQNTENNKINWYFYGDTDVTSYSYGDFGGAYMVVDIRTQGSQLFWSLYTKPELDGEDQEFWYRSRVTYDNASGMQASVPGRYLVHTANLDVTGIEPLLPRISLPVEPGATVGPQGGTEEVYLMALNTSSGLAAGTNEFVVEKVGMKLGDFIQAYDLVAVPTTSAQAGATTPTTIDFERDVTGTTISDDAGQQFGVNTIRAVSNGDNTIDIINDKTGEVIYDNLDMTQIQVNGVSAGNTEAAITNALNSLFFNTPLGDGGSYVPTFPTIDAADVTYNLAEGITPTTEVTPGTNHLYGAGADTSGHGARLWSNETIDTAGEYFLVKIIGNGRFIIGFADGTTDSDTSGTADDLEELANNSGSSASGLFWSQAFYDYGSYSAPWTWYGSSASGSYGPGWTGASTGMMRYNNDVQAALVAGSGSGVLFKAGIDSQGYLAVWYWDEGRSDDWIMCSRRSAATPGDRNYHLVVKLWNGSSTIVEIPQRVATDPVAPALNYRFIESPDGEFYYPLFATSEEAEYVDTANGGSGASHTHIFVDEPTNSTWYMPSTGGVHAGASAPLDTAEITYTRIDTEADSLHAPSQLTLQNQTAAENTAVNLQIIPQDTIATVTGLPTGLNYSLGFITGTTPYVAEDTDYVITVERSNNYGTTSQTFTLTITDNASLGDFTGFTGYGGNLVQPNRMILTDDALVQYDTVLSEDQQITWSYSDGALPPSIGILSTAGETALAGLNGNTLGSTGYDFAQTSMWDLRFVTGNNWIGGSIGQTHSELIGWEDNTTIQGTNNVNLDVEFKLAYEHVHSGNHYELVLYRDGVEMLRSADQYSGDQTITLAAFGDQTQSDVYIPANWTITNIGAGSTTPPTGFADPLLEGTMGATTLLGDGTDVDAAAQFTQQLEVNHRYIFPQTWIEANILPYVQDDGNDVYVGVPDAAASWTDVGTGDFEAMFKIEGTDSTSHVSKIKVDPLDGDNFSINSLTNAFYDYALEWDGEDLHVIACNIGDINTQPGVSSGGSFSRVMTYTGFGTANLVSGQPLNIVIGIDNGGQANLTTAGLQHIRIPFGGNDILVGEASNGDAEFSALQPVGSLFDANNGGHAPSTFTYAAPTLNAGYTYRFVYHASMESGDYIEFRRADTGAVYNTGVTSFGSGDPAFAGNYKGIEFAVPADAPPLNVYYYNSYQSGYFDGGRELPISGSTYVVPVTGVTIEGPAANFTGNVINAASNGWLSLNETLSAGERLVLDSAFIQDLNDALPDHCIFWVGLKANGWTNTTFPTNSFFGRTALRFYNTSAGSEPGLRMMGYADGGTSSQVYSASLANSSAFLEITGTGNNIRVGYYNSTAMDAAATTFADWDGNTKIQTGDKGYGIDSLEVVLYWQALGSNAVGFDISDVDWTGLSEISIPQPAATLTTSWNKALDFSGSAERAQTVSNASTINPVQMAGTGSVRAAPFNPGNTTSTGGHPWATAVVFSSDNHSSNQHIWNQGEGAGSTDDNIYLRVDANRNLYFGWGRQGALNECSLGTLSSGSNQWYGIYIAHNGARFTGANATAANLAASFDIRGINLSTGVVGSQISTSSNWITTGGRMDRTYTGDFTIGGRGSNRSFHGKIASMVVTTLRNNVAMPTTAEISMMVRDPEQWMQDYKVSRNFRRPHQTIDTGSFAVNTSIASYSTQIWLMGDGQYDAYAQMRNQVWSASQNYTAMNMISMVSNDIQTVNIPGLT